MSRWRAASIHFGISLLVFALAFAWMRFVWYPQPYFAAIGADGLLQILVAVDVCLGPLATLVVFRSGKKGLRFDLAVIGMLQLAALVYGLYVVAIVRPAYVVFVKDRFDVVPAGDLIHEGTTDPQFAGAPWTGPRIVAAVPPADPTERENFMFQSFESGRDLQAYTKFYRPFEDQARTAAAAAKPLASLLSKQPDVTAEAERLLAGAGLGREDAVYLPLVARHRDMAMVLSRGDGRILGWLPADPW